VDDDATTVFERERSHLFGVAYRMLGSAAEADDVLQDAYLRWADHREVVASPRAFLTTVVVRLCLDAMKSARARRESYVGEWLPEPLVSGDATTESPPGPDARAELAESLTVAFLVVLERLSPLERAAFLLRDVFDRPTAEVAEALGTSEVACRQLLVRARAHVEENRPRYQATESKKRELLGAFIAACASADATGLERILAEDATLRSDGGGKVQAARKPVHGRDRVARFLLGVLEKGAEISRVEEVLVNGEPGAVLHGPSGVVVAVTVSVREEEIADVWIVVNPDKLARIGLTARGR